MRTFLLHSRHCLAAFLIGLFACTQVARAEDIEIYTNPAANTLQPPMTVLVLDLNALGICDNIITNPNNSQACIDLQSNKLVSDLIGNSQLMLLDPGTLCNLFAAVGGTGTPQVNFGFLGLSTLLCSPATGLLSATGLIGGLLNTVTGLLGLGLTQTQINTFISTLVGGITNKLLNKTISQLPNTVRATLNTTLSGVQKILVSPTDITNLTSLLNGIVGSLINSKIAIVVSHADRRDNLGNRASGCSFGDLASIATSRRQTTACSNGAFFLAGFLNVGGTGLVEGLVGDLGSFVVSKVVDALTNPVSLLTTASNTIFTALTTPTELLPPYQGKEVYAEIMQYLGGWEVYNAPLYAYDILGPNLIGNTSTIAGNLLGGNIVNGSNYRQPDSACKSINVLNVQVSANKFDNESDSLLRTRLPTLPSTGTITLADVVKRAQEEGFRDGSNNKITLRSMFLVNSLAGDLTALSNAGATIANIAFDQAGLLGLGQTVAQWVKPVLNVDASLLTPSLTADLVTPSSVREEAFFSLFKPDVNQKPRWPGNLKKLKVRTDANGNFQYYDANSMLAIASDGRIATNALTFWTDTAKLGTATRDGRSSTLGGAGQKIPGYVFGGGGAPGRANSQSARQLFYDKLTGASSLLSLGALDADTATTTAVTELVTDTGATAETAATCGTAKTAAQVNQEILLYARGYDTGSSCAGSKGVSAAVVGRDWMHGALLHSRPVAINYGARTGFSATSPDIRVVYGAADGFMRMVKNTDGSESWGFMPRVLMSQQAVLRNNTATPALPFGADGAPAVLVQDRSTSNGPADGKIESTNANDRAWLFFGLRRSGRHYYAMNVTNPDAPTLMWRIGPDGIYRSTGLVSGSATFYSELGLSFSTPQVGRMTVRDNGVDTTKPVLIFAGGYAGGRDASNNRLGKDLRRGSDGLVGLDDTSGNAIYIVDAETGDLIWKAKQGTFNSANPYTSSSRSFLHPLLVNSIPADVNIIDSDGNGLTDRMYVVDTGGRLWRGDFPGSDRTAWTLTPLASVGRHRSATVLNDRRFFQAPDYAPFRNARGGYDAIVFGSGDREDPLNLTTENFLYVYRDYRTAIGRPATDVLTTDASLKGQTDFVDLTTTCASGTVGCADSANLSTGFRLKLAGSGEKVLSQPLSTSGTVFFSTYLPPNPAAARCEPSEGTSKLYGISLRDSRPLFNRFITDGDGDARSQLSLTPGLPGEFNALTATSLAANGQTLALPATPPYTIYWRERRGDEETKP